MPTCPSHSLPSEFKINLHFYFMKVNQQIKNRSIYLFYISETQQLSTYESLKQFKRKCNFPQCLKETHTCALIFLIRRFNSDKLINLHYRQFFLGFNCEQGKSVGQLLEMSKLRRNQNKYVRQLSSLHPMRHINCEIEIVTYSYIVYNHIQWEEGVGKHPSPSAVVMDVKEIMKLFKECRI